tara:strand:+ start:4340 stop:4624 length:285 start_codon:yes stop_codon:yes gene_type:complete
MPEDENKEFTNKEFVSRSSSGMGRETMMIVLSAIQKTNEEALDAVVEQSSASQKRMTLIIALVITILAGVVGVTASVTLPGGATVGATPEKATP